MVMSGWHWSLLEAGRLWKEQRYTDIGSALLKRIAREEVVTVQAGSMLLPGKVGFAEDNSWRFNPSYLPPTLAQYFTALARRGPRCAKPINVYCWKPPQAFARLGAL